MLRPKPEASLEAIRRTPCVSTRPRPVPVFSGKRHLNRPAKPGACSDLSEYQQAVTCPDFSGKRHLNRRTPCGLNNERSESQPSNPQPAQPVFPNHFVSGIYGRGGAPAEQPLCVRKPQWKHYFASASALEAALRRARGISIVASGMPGALRISMPSRPAMSRTRTD